MVAEETAYPWELLQAEGRKNPQCRYLTNHPTRPLEAPVLSVFQSADRSITEQIVQARKPRFGLPTRELETAVSRPHIADCGERATGAAEPVSGEAESSQCMFPSWRGQRPEPEPTSAFTISGDVSAGDPST